MRIAAVAAGVCLTLVALAGCPDSGDCLRLSDCPTGDVCTNGKCVVASAGDDGSADGSDDRMASTDVVGSDASADGAALDVASDARSDGAGPDDAQNDGAPADDGSPQAVEASDDAMATE